MQAQKDARAFEPFSLVGVTIFQILLVSWLGE